MASFPTLSFGTVALYPLTEVSEYRTSIMPHVDGSEQRWRQRAPLASFVLQLDRISQADKNTVQAFFDTTKGGFDSTWDITIGGTLYSYMTFEDSGLDVTESEPMRYSMSIRIRQTRKN